MKFFSQIGQDRFLLENFFRGKRGGVLVPVSRGITRIADRSLSIADYAGLIGERIASFKEMLASIHQGHMMIKARGPLPTLFPF